MLNCIHFLDKKSTIDTSEVTAMGNTIHEEDVMNKVKRWISTLDVSEVLAMVMLPIKKMKGAR